MGKCDGCNEVTELQKVTVIWNDKPLEFNYCDDCIKEDLYKGFVVLNEENKQFVFKKEEFYLSDKVFEQ
jgi:hypothetical protein